MYKVILICFLFLTSLSQPTLAESDWNQLAWRECLNRTGNAFYKREPWRRGDHQQAVGFVKLLYACLEPYGWVDPQTGESAKEILLQLDAKTAKRPAAPKQAFQNPPAQPSPHVSEPLPPQPSFGWFESFSAYATAVGRWINQHNTMVVAIMVATVTAIVVSVFRPFFVGLIPSRTTFLRQSAALKQKGQKWKVIVRQGFALVAPHFKSAELWRMVAQGVLPVIVLAVFIGPHTWPLALTLSLTVAFALNFYNKLSTITVRITRVKYIRDGTQFALFPIAPIAALSAAVVATTFDDARRFLIGLISLLFLLGWWRVSEHLKFTFFKSVDAYLDALQAQKDPAFYPIDLWHRIRSALIPTTIEFDRIVEALHDGATFEVPEPPWSSNSEREHVEYRHRLEQLKHTVGFLSKQAEDAFIDTVVAALAPVARLFPAATGPTLFTTPLADAIDGLTLADVLAAFSSPGALQHGLFKDLRKQLDANAAAHANSQFTTLRQAAETYLANTPLIMLLYQRVPLWIKFALWFEHVHIIAKTGSLKTQLLQSVFVHLVQMPVPPSFIIIDSQGPMLELIERKMRPVLGNKLLHINPQTTALNLNLLDVDLRGLSESERGAIINRLASLFTFLFNAGSLELSNKMRTYFDQVLLLLIEGIPAAEKRKATLKDLQGFVAAPKPWETFKAAIVKLPGESQTFFARANIGSYSETAQQVDQRLRSVLREPMLKKMLTAPTNDLRMEDYLDHGGIILVNTNISYLQAENSAFFGRLFIMLAQQAMYRRKPLPSGNPYPAALMMDEAHEYFGATTEIQNFLAQARKYRFSCVLAHQRFSQASSALQSALTGCAIHMASRLNEDDLRPLAAIMHTSPEFLGAQRREKVPEGREPQWCDYALYHDDLNTAVSVRVEYGVLEGFTPASRKQSAPPPPPPGSGPTPQPGQYDMRAERTLHPKVARDGGTFKDPDPADDIPPIRIHPGTKDGAVYRVKGFGARRPNGTRGDLYIKFNVPPMPRQDNDDDEMDLGAKAA